MAQFGRKESHYAVKHAAQARMATPDGNPDTDDRTECLKWH